MSIKLCENCINDVKTSQEQPCLDCRKGSGWESKSVGCEFCRGESGKICAYGRSTISKNELRNEIRVAGGKAFYLDYKINFCPMCGKKLEEV